MQYLWLINSSYERGDIVQISSDDLTNENFLYYVCLKNHKALFPLYPMSNKELWMNVNSEIINQSKSWTLNESYTHNEIVTFENKYYICIGKIISKFAPTISRFWIFLPDDLISILTKSSLKRKLSTIESDLNNFISSKKTKKNNLSKKEEILLLNTDLTTKSFLLEKYNEIKYENKNGGDYEKNMKWLNTIISLPFNTKKDYTINLKKIKATLDSEIYGQEKTKNHILQFFAKKLSNPGTKGEILALHGSPGIGKCFALDTPILYYDGTIKPVQDVSVGDILMGDDSTPRNVLALGKGQDIMYEITSHRDTYTVNSAHILCLKFKTEMIFDNKYYKVEFLKKDTELVSTAFFNRYDEARNFSDNQNNVVHEISVSKYLELSAYIKSRLQGFYCDPIEFETFPIHADPYMSGFKKIHSKETIPYEYKCNSKSIRQSYLAGFLDSQGYFEDSYYHLNLKNISQTFIDDLVFLCKSLGFICLENTDMNEMYIHGDFQSIPTLLKHLDDYFINLNYNINVKEIGMGDYYGFMIDGNERFILGNFIVTHNTKIIKDGLAKAIDVPFFQINCGGLNDVSVITGHSSTYSGSKPGKIIDILSQSKCNNPIIYLDELDKISEQKKQELYGIFTHIFDQQQNKTFQDNYIGNTEIDLSNVLFVISFNHMDKIDPILLDRFKIIHLDNPSFDDKIHICKKMFREVFKSIWVDKITFSFEDGEEVFFNYLISQYHHSDVGVRQIKRSLEIILDDLNLKRHLEDNNDTTNIITLNIKQIDDCLATKDSREEYLNMYI